MHTSRLLNEVAPGSRATRRATRLSRYFYVLVGLLALLFTLVGFSGTYLIPVSTGTFAGRRIHHIHGVVYFAWLVLVIVQPILVQSRNVRIHKRLGYLGLVLAMGMVVVGLTLAISSARLRVLSGSDISAVKAFLILPFTDMFFFAGFVGLGLLNSRNAAAHKRLMVLATLAILPPAFGRMFPMLGMTEFTPANVLLGLLLQHSILFLGMLHDRLTRARIHPVYLWGGLSMLIVHLIRIPLGNTALWQSVAGVLAGL